VSISVDVCMVHAMGNYSYLIATVQYHEGLSVNRK